MTGSGRSFVAAPAPDAASRGQLHVACAIAGMLGNSVWSIVVLGAGAENPRAARWFSLANVIGFASVVLIGHFMQRRAAPRLTLDRVCIVLTMGILIVWSTAAGTGSSWLTSLPPLLILVHWIHGGPSQGAVAWASATLFRLVALAASAALLRSSSAQTPVIADLGFSAAGILLTYAAPAWLGGWLTKNGSTRRHEGAPGRRPKREEPRRRRHLVGEKYRLVRRLGQGPNGRVFESVRLSDDTPLALKVLRRRWPEFDGPLARLRQEIDSVSAALPPDRIVQVAEIGREASGRAFVAMELLEGEDLEARLRRAGRLSPAEVADIVDRLADVLDRAADHGIVHGRLKATNVFLSRVPNGTVGVRLLDYGMDGLQSAVSAAGSARSGALGVTQDILAPEQITAGFGERGAHTDVFGLACVAYEALCGRRPFTTSNAAGALYEVLNQNPPPVHNIVPELPGAIDCVLTVGLAKRATDRYARASQFARDLRAALREPCPKALAERARSLLATQVPFTQTLTL
jgi:hypothetical protein